MGLRRKASVGRRLLAEKNIDVTVTKVGWVGHLGLQGNEEQVDECNWNSVVGNWKLGHSQGSAFPLSEKENHERV